MKYERVISRAATPTALTSDMRLAILMADTDCCAGCLQCLGRCPTNALQIVSSFAATSSDGCQRGVTVKRDDLRTC